MFALLLRSSIISLFTLLTIHTQAFAIDWPPTLNPDSNVQPPKWDWQLKVPVQLNEDDGIEIYDIDMFDNESTGMVGLLQSYGKRVICYVNVGAWEDFRDDEQAFPRSILGNVYDRFPNEKWLDIRDVNPEKSTTGMALRSILEARLDRAKAIGCDAVEPDNMDGFDESSHNPSGFPLSYEDQIYFNLWLSNAVRERGMAVGFKNNTNQALDPRMVDAFDFVVTESCVYFNECQYFSGFLNANKPVFLTEYLMTPDELVSVGQEYTLSCDAMRQDTPWSIVQLSFLDEQYTNLTTQIVQLASGGSYSRYTLIGTTPANSKFAVALVYSEDQALIDNCQLIAKTEANL